MLFRSGTFAQNAQTSASSASQSRQYAATSAQQANDSALAASGARDDAVAAAGLAEEQAGLAAASADRADQDQLGARVDTLSTRVDSRPACFSGVGEPVDVPNAVAGDYYFDTESGELHKITGV